MLRTIDRRAASSIRSSQRRDPTRPHSSALNRHMRRPRGHSETCGASSACKPERHRDAGGVVDRAFAMRMTVDMRTDHDPIRASARQVGNQHVRPRGMIIAVDDHAGGWQACRPANGATPPPFRHRCRVPGCLAPPLRPLEPDTGPTPASGCAIRNPTAPICCASPSLTRRCACPVANGYSWRTMTIRPRMRFACRSKSSGSAQTEIEDFRHEPGGRCRAQKRRAGERHAGRRAE